MSRSILTGANRLPNDWYDGAIPGNVRYDASNFIESSYSFRYFRSRSPDALTLGRGASIYTNATLDFGLDARVSIGAFAMLNGTKIICDDSITIGDYCLVSWNVVLMDNYRVPHCAVKRRSYVDALLNNTDKVVGLQDRPRPIAIEANVWIGHDTVVLPGVTIGMGAVIGARSVVFGSIPQFSVAAGNPARVLRSLESD